MNATKVKVYLLRKFYQVKLTSFTNFRVPSMTFSKARVEISHNFRVEYSVGPVNCRKPVASIIICLLRERARYSYLTRSVHKHAKKELGQYPAILTERAWSINHIFSWESRRQRAPENKTFMLVFFDRTYNFEFLHV